MKRLALFALAFAMILNFCGCNAGKPDVAHNEDSTVKDTTAVSDETTTAPDDEKDIHVSLSQKLIDEIDGAYREESFNSSSTTLGMIELANKYKELWEEKADEYYKKLMEYEDPDLQDYLGYIYTTDDLHTFVSDMKNTWETYSKAQRENYLKVLQTIYGPGTIVGPLIAEYEYDMQMEWTLELVEICEQLGIE